MEVLKLATKTLQLAIQAAITGVKSVVDAIKITTDATKVKVDSTATKVDGIDVKVGTLMDGRVVKSVQRGIFRPGQVNIATIVISTVNPSKCKVDLTGSFIRSGYPYLAIPYSLTSNELKIQAAGTTSIPFDDSSNVSWEIIEFY